LFNNHCNYEGDVVAISFAMGTCQGDPLGGALFALIHYKTLLFRANQFHSYLFPSIAYDIHIIGPLSIISSIYDHFQTKVCAIGIYI